MTSPLSPRDTTSADILPGVSRATDGPATSCAGPSFYSQRRESLAQSAQAMQGKSGVSRMRHLLSEATHTLLAAELQGRD